MTSAMDNLLGILLQARNVAQMWHWKVKSFSQHMALGELYQALDEMTDTLAEQYMGTYGTDGHIPLGEPSGFSEQDPLEFIRQLHSILEQLSTSIPQDGFLVNTYQELQGKVARVKYKLENLS